MGHDESIILLTGFDSFGDGQPNSSEWLVRQLNGACIGQARVVGHVLPTCFGQAAQELRLLSRRLNKQARLPLIVCTGMAADRPGLSLEHVAINWRDAPVADNAGRQPKRQLIAPKGPTAYFSSLNLQGLCDPLRNSGVQASVSHSAGTFVCNEVFYALMRMLASKRTWGNTRGGFVHLPALSPQLDQNLGLPLDQAMRQLLQLALNHQ